MRHALLLVAVIGAAHCMPQAPSDAAAAEDNFANVADVAGRSTSYNTNADAVDPSIIDELFGGNQINQGYTKPSKQNIDTSYAQCIEYAPQGFQCVPYYECDDGGEIITDGGPGLIDIRGNFGVNVELDVENSKCPGYLDVCCRHPDFYQPVTEAGSPTTEAPYIPPTTPRAVPAPYRSRCGKHNPNGIGIRIVNGNAEASTQFGEWPHMCAVLEEKGGKNLYVCGGSLIADGIVMTAAHCVDKKDYANLKLRCGEWDTQRQIEPAAHQDRDVYDMKVHPGYSGKNLTNDVALLFTDHNNPFVLSDHLDTICLPDLAGERAAFKQEDCIGTGWGKDEFGAEGEYQVILKQVTVGLWDQYECQDALRKTVVGKRFNLDPTSLCAGGRGGVDTCKGDGGGPLICPTGDTVTDSYNTVTNTYVQVGIVGWGVGCGQEGIPGVYTDVAKMMCFVDWATKCVRGESYGPWGEGCGRGWAVQQREHVRNARRSWEGIAHSILPKSSKTVDRRVEQHFEAEEKWDYAIDGCAAYPYSPPGRQDGGGGGYVDPYQDYGYDQSNLGSVVDVRSEAKKEDTNGEEGEDADQQKK
jgi:kallikrein